MMRLALFADIHGNLLALEAVLADIEAQGSMDGYVLVGDYAALGYAPVETMERLIRLPNALFVRGNTDRYLTSGEYPPPTIEDARNNPALILILAEVSRSFAWTQGQVMRAGYFVWLDQLPIEQRLTLPDGTQLLAVHASPGNDDGEGIKPNMSREYLASMLEDCEADLIVVGHTHWVQDYSIDGLRLVNVGCVSNPFPPDLRASYVLLEADEAGYQLDFRQVDYDRQAAIEALKRVRHPAATYIINHLSGKLHPEWWQDYLKLTVNGKHET